jgi:sterol desaturase/sphingolipid hydroxylase (fatty acid hydroxylase superfamily)
MAHGVYYPYTNQKLINNKPVHRVHHYNFGINHVNIQSCLEILNFEFKKSKN